MASAFTTIMVPVDFSVNTEVAIKKAIELAVPGQTTIHLFHVDTQASIKSGILVKSGNVKNERVSPDEKMKQWKDMILELGLGCCTWINTGSAVQQAIIAKVKRICPDLVIIGKTVQHRWLPFMNTVHPVAISEQTATAVLLARPGSMHNTIRTVVVPVGEKFLQQKVELLSTLCRKMRLKIHLVAFASEESSAATGSGALVKVYQWLKSTLHCPVEYSVLYGNNKPKALLAYAEKIHADTLLLHPGNEVRSAWPYRHIADMLPANSKVQVLTVQPPIESHT